MAAGADVAQTRRWGQAGTPPAGRHGRRSLARFLALMALVVAGLYAATLVLPHPTYHRYQGYDETENARLRWIYERIHFDPTPIDVAILGTSREGAAFDAAQVEQALAARGLRLHVANLALPGAGLDLRAALLKELLKARNPALVIVSVSEVRPRKGHPLFVEIADLEDILLAPPLDRRFAVNLFRLPMRQLELGLAALVPGALGKSARFDPDAYDGTQPFLSVRSWRNNVDPGPWSPGVPAEEHRQRLARQSLLLYASLPATGRPEPLDRLLFSHADHYLRAMARAVRADGGVLAFSFVPFYDGPAEPRDRAALEAIAPVWSLPGVRGDAARYIDSGHLEEGQRGMAAVWLAGRIAGALAGRRPEAPLASAGAAAPAARAPAPAASSARASALAPPAPGQAARAITPTETEIR